MRKIKNFCVLLMFSCSVFSYAMEVASSEDQSIKKICYDIDKNILGINPDGMFKSIVGSFASCCKVPSFWDDREKAIKQLSAVEALIPVRLLNKVVFQKLWLKHWHASNLINALVKDEIEQLKNVRCSTIDDLLNVDKPIVGLSQQMSTFIHQSAHKSYMREMKLDKPLDSINFDNEKNEIHFVTLETFGASKVSTLFMSNDGKYLKGITSGGKLIAWDMEDGTTVDSYVQELSDERQCFMDQYIAHNDYLAVLGAVQLPGTYSILAPILNGRHSSEVFLFKRPTLASFLCRQLLCNSSTKKLLKLKNSQTVENLKGFLWRNLLAKIDSEIKCIAAKSQLLNGA